MNEPDQPEPSSKDISKPSLDRFENIKLKLKNVLNSKRYCGLCMELCDDMITIEIVFEVNFLHRIISIKNMIHNVFDNKSIPTSEYICNSCVDQLINSYLFIASIKFTTEVFNVYISSLIDKADACDLGTVEKLDSSNIAMILDYTEIHRYFPEKIKIDNSKSVNARDKKSFKCTDCSIIISDHDEFQLHKRTHNKLEYECSMCEKVYKNEKNLLTHYTIHEAVKCKLCHELLSEKNLNYHLKTVHKDSVFECQHCDIVFYKKHALEAHVNVSHKISPKDRCPMCSKHCDINSHKCRFSCSQCKVVRCKHLEYLKSYRDQRLKGNKVKCPHCDYIANRRETFLGHVNRVHLKYRPFTCTFCTLKFTSKINLHSHIHRVHTENYVCGYCDDQFKEKNILESHIKYCQLIKRDYICKKCLASFDTKEEIVRHTEYRHSDLYQCQMCNKEFLHKSRLKYHIQRFHHTSISISEQANYDENTASHIKKKETESCICDNCGKTFSSTDALKSHLKIHQDKVPCPECKKKFFPIYLKVHHKRHLALKDPIIKEKLRRKAKVKCSQCDYVTYDAKYLEGHINRHHKKIKPYSCLVCNKEFMGQLHLKRHMQCHTGDNSRKCELCFKVLANKDCFRMHMRLHTGEKPYACDICGDRFRSSSIMNVHKNRMHAEKSAECPICSSMFYTVRELRSHCRRVHWKHKDRKFNYKELEGLREEHYYLFHDGRTPIISKEKEDL